MGMTMTQKILAKGRRAVLSPAGQLIEARLNLVLGNDITTPVAITEFEKAGFTQVFDKDRICHCAGPLYPLQGIKSASCASRHGSLPISTASPISTTWARWA